MRLLGLLAAALLLAPVRALADEIYTYTGEVYADGYSSNFDPVDGSSTPVHDYNSELVAASVTIDFTLGLGEAVTVDLPEAHFPDTLYLNSAFCSDPHICLEIYFLYDDGIFSGLPPAVLLYGSSEPYLYDEGIGFYGGYTGTLSLATTPEPSTVVLLLTGIVGSVGVLVRRRKYAADPMRMS